mgnify:CR=1 FL=1
MKWNRHTPQPVTGSPGRIGGRSGVGGDLSDAQEPHQKLKANLEEITQMISGLINGLENRKD